jgi:hypothetical protein
MVERGVTFLCLADEKQKRRMPFMFLEDVRSRFLQTYGDRAATAIAFAMNAEFARVLQERMVRARERGKALERAMPSPPPVCPSTSSAPDPLPSLTPPPSLSLTLFRRTSTTTTPRPTT